jgi:hypothetical protein
LLIPDNNTQQRYENIQRVVELESSKRTKSKYLIEMRRKSRSLTAFMMFAMSLQC